MTTKTIETNNAEQTINIGVALGKCLRGGECVELIADVGGGKTTLVRGIAKGAGSKQHVSSPTFTISKVYKAPEFDIVHFDFYRLQEAGLVAYEIEDAIYDSKSVVIIEWSDVVEHVLPEERLQITLQALSENERKLTFIIPDKLDYLAKDLK